MTKARQNADSVDKINLGDNEKLQLGDGNDLQIYHDGSHSYIQDAGTGNLVIETTGGDQVSLLAGGEYMLRARKDGQTGIYYDGYEKLATTSTGVDVTGTVTADGLTVDGATDPTIRLHNTGTVGSGELLGTVEFYQEDGSSPGAGVVASIEARNTDAASGAGSLAFTAGYSNSNNDRMLINSNGDISFYEDTGTTAKFFWDASAERLGIGTTSPTRQLEVYDATAAHLNIKSGTSGIGYLNFGDSDDDNSGRVAYANSDDSMQFFTSASEAMRIDSDGNVGIGTDDPTSLLDIKGDAGNSVITLNSAAAIDNYPTIGKLEFYSNDNSTNSAGEVGSLEVIGISTWNGASNNAAMTFNLIQGLAGTTSPVEAMRIDNSGRLLVNNTTGTPSGSLYDGAVEVVAPTLRNGIKTRVNSNAYVAYASEGPTTSGGNFYYHSFMLNGSGSGVGTIKVSHTGTAYNTTSDYRLKENVVDLTGAITRLNNLDVKRFNFIDDDTDTTVDGFIAHEVQAVVPEAVTGTHNEVDDDGNPVYQGIDQSKLVPLLTAALQEAIAKIDALETRIETLENA